MQYWKNKMSTDHKITSALGEFYENNSDRDKYLNSLSRFLHPAHEPVNRFKNFVFYLKQAFEYEAKNNHQHFCRAVREAAGLPSDCQESGYPNPWPFDSNSDELVHFTDSLMERLSVRVKRRFKPSLFRHKMADILGETSWDALMAKFKIYESLLNNNWTIAGTKIKKPRLVGLGLLMPGTTFGRYGCVSFGQYYRFISFNSLMPNFYCVPSDNPFVFPSGCRTWGETKEQAMLWTVASELINYGPKSWNLYIQAQNPRYECDVSRQKSRRACSAMYKWIDSNAAMDWIKTVASQS